LRAILSDDDITIESLTPITPTLEDVFIELVSGTGK
jgi:hypothetical protein